MVVLGVAVRFFAAQLAIAVVVAPVTVKAGAGCFGTFLQQLIIVGCVSLIVSGGGPLCLPRLWRRSGRQAGG